MYTFFFFLKIKLNLAPFRTLSREDRDKDRVKDRAKDIKTMAKTEPKTEPNTEPNRGKR